jgi:hypothetical protein
VPDTTTLVRGRHRVEREEMRRERGDEEREK